MDIKTAIELYNKFMKGEKVDTAQFIIAQKTIYDFLQRYLELEEQGGVKKKEITAYRFDRSTAWGIRMYNQAISDYNLWRAGKLDVEKIQSILENYEYDLVNFSVAEHQDIRDKYDGEIDNLWKQLAQAIVDYLMGK